MQREATGAFWRGAGIIHLCCLKVTLISVTRTNGRDVSGEIAALNGAGTEECSRRRKREMWTVSRSILEKECPQSILMDWRQIERKREIEYNSCACDSRKQMAG